MEVKFPDVEVQLTGVDGNAFAILGAVQRSLKKAGVDKAGVDAEMSNEFLDEATSGDYDHLLATVMRWVKVV